MTMMMNDDDDEDDDDEDGDDYDGSPYHRTRGEISVLSRRFLGVKSLTKYPNSPETNRNRRDLPRAVDIV